MRALWAWLDQWGRNVALARENRVLRDELETALDQGVDDARDLVWFRAFHDAIGDGLKYTEAHEYADGVLLTRWTEPTS